MDSQSARRDWHPYAPDDVTPPGETLRETLELLNMSQSKLAARTGMTLKHINQITQGKALLTSDTALVFERATGVPASIWNGLEARYREHRSRIDEQKVLEGEAKWLKQMPLASLRKLGHVTATAKYPGVQLQEALKFFGVASVETWRDCWEEPAAAFLQSSAFHADVGAVAAWLRLGEIAASRVDCGTFDRGALKALAPDLRAMTVQDPSDFYPRLVAKCAQVGVVVVVAAEVPGAHASGASRFLSPHKAIVQLSNRGKRNDKFWFALFHEIGHLVRHGKKDVFVENNIGYDGGRLGLEEEANRFAGDILIPPEHDAELSGISNYEDVRTFATKIGVAPGIVAGRLQHERGDFTFGVPGLFQKYEIVSGSK
jgi:HTH-type transcriptional regulator / antitoxin HigA